MTWQSELARDARAAAGDPLPYTAEALMAAAGRKDAVASTGIGVRQLERIRLGERILAGEQVAYDAQGDVIKEPKRGMKFFSYPGRELEVRYPSKDAAAEIKKAIDALNEKRGKRPNIRVLKLEGKVTISNKTEQRTIEPDDDEGVIDAENLEEFYELLAREEDDEAAAELIQQFFGSWIGIYQSHVEQMDRFEYRMEA